MLIFYDKYMNQLKEIDFIEASWNRKFNEAGDFMLHTTSENWNPEIKYIKNSGRKETAIVQKVIQEQKTDGKFITASGFFCEKVLDWGCNFISKSISAKSEKVARNKINDYLDETCNTALKSIRLDGSPILSTIDQTIEVGTPTGQFLYGLFLGNEQSFWCEPIIGRNESEPLMSIIVHPYFGEDKRDEVYFGDGFGNVSSIRYHFDESGEYPSIGIIQEVQAASGFSNVQSLSTKDGVKYFITETVTEEANKPKDLGACYPLKVISGNVSDIEMVSANQTAIRRAMKEQGRLEMLNHYKVETVEADVLQETFFYLKDYDIGDICTIIFDSVKKSFSARIIEIQEVFRKNQTEIKLIFGTPRKQKYIAIN